MFPVVNGTKELKIKRHIAIIVPVKIVFRERYTIKRVWFKVI